MRGWKATLLLSYLLTEIQDSRFLTISLLTKIFHKISVTGHCINSSRIGWGFDIFQKVSVKFPTPGQKCESNITKFPTPRNDLWSRARTKIQISLPPGQQENSNALPPGQIKAIDQNPGLFFVLLVTISKPPRMMSSSANYRPFLSSSRHIPPSGAFCQVSKLTI